jgi:ADP-ribose pyrophosphatase YjhB (NUDIX family)
MPTHRLRVAAYAVCTRGDLLLLARFVSADGAQRHWALPGGGVEHGEDPHDAVIREVAEETGYQVEVERLLGIGSHTHRPTGGTDGSELHRLSVFYRVRITGGELRNEVDGSTDLAAWMPADEVPRLPRAVSVDTGLELDRTLPPGGHVHPVSAGGLLRP